MPRPARRTPSGLRILPPPAAAATPPLPRRRGHASPSAAESVLRTQDRLLSAFETFWHGWFDRRHAAGDEAIGLARRLARAGSTHPERAAAAWADWRAGLVERLSADMQAGIDLWISCGGQLGAAEAEATASATRPGRSGGGEAGGGPGAPPG
jgi:hypothetical protein